MAAGRNNAVSGGHEAWHCGRVFDVELGSSVLVVVGRYHWCRRKGHPPGWRQAWRGWMGVWSLQRETSIGKAGKSRKTEKGVILEDWSW